MEGYLRGAVYGGLFVEGCVLRAVYGGLFVEGCLWRTVYGGYGSGWRVALVEGGSEQRVCKCQCLGVAARLSVRCNLADFRAGVDCLPLDKGPYRDIT